MRRVGRRTAKEVGQVDSWTRHEVQQILEVALEHESRYHPALSFLFATGTRRGEMLGLKWQDIDFNQGRITIRRAIVAGQVTTPKSGRSRVISAPSGLIQPAIRLDGLQAP